MESYENIFCCVSDLHLTKNSINKCIIQLEKQLQLKYFEHIILLGDSIDEKVEEYDIFTRKKFIKQYYQLLEIILKYCEKCIVLYGNHDELFIKKHINPYIKNSSINQQIHFKYTFTLTNSENNYIFLHGHQFDTRYIYHKINTKLQIPVSIKKFLKSKMKTIIPYIHISKERLNAKSKKYILKNNFKDSEKTIFIFGHFHAYEHITSSKDNNEYFSLSCWNKNDSIPIYTNQDIKINSMYIKQL